MARAAKTVVSDEPEASTLEAIKSEVSKLTATELSSLIKFAQEGFETKRREAKKDLIARVREEAAALQIDVADLFPSHPMPSQGSGRGVRKGTTVPDKYRSPTGETWTGRGRTPAWMVGLESQGKARDEFLIDPAT